MDTLQKIERLYLPVAEEIVAEDLTVEGELPAELEGEFVRNGPNPRSGASAHPFLGDGMLHAVTLAGGRALRYANRWVRTPNLEQKVARVGPDGTVDLRVSVANTNVIAHAGKMFALVEVALPYEVRRDLSTVGAYDFGGRLNTPMTAHPKTCPLTGELHFFGMEPVPGHPALTYHRATREGELVESREIPVPGRTMMHDFAITARNVVFMDLPVVFDLQRLMQGTMPYAWSDTYGARFGVMPRGGNGAVRWFDVEPCYVFHVLNAYDDGDRVVVDGVRYPEIWRENTMAFPPAALHRWTLDAGTGTVREERLDDLPVEFPRADERRTGLEHRFGYAAHFRASGGGAIVKYDLERKTSVRCDFGEARTPGEPVFVPARSEGGEDRGWLLTYVYDAERDASDFVVLEARDLTVTATVRLPVRVPFGFHGNWFDANR